MKEKRTYKIHALFSMQEEYQFSTMGSVTAVKELCVVVDLVFVAGRDIDMKFKDLNPNAKIKRMLRKEQ